MLMCEEDLYPSQEKVETDQDGTEDDCSEGKVSRGFSDGKESARPLRKANTERELARCRFLTFSFTDTNKYGSHDVVELFRR
jgi:hypothetical protein